MKHVTHIKNMSQDVY